MRGGRGRGDGRGWLGVDGGVGGSLCGVEGGEWWVGCGGGVYDALILGVGHCGGMGVSWLLLSGEGAERVKAC